jgi:hypothetical protein
MDSFNFIDRPPTIRARNDYNKVIAFLIVLIMVLICLILSTILLRMVNKTQTAIKTTIAVTAAADHLITKEEWRAKYKKWNDKWCGKWHDSKDSKVLFGANEKKKASLFEEFGKPFKSQTIQGTEFWYWQCSDGVIQVVKHDNRTWYDGSPIYDVNDY